ncbi:MAG: YncE family protein [Bacteroidia bacterium]
MQKKYWSLSTLLLIISIISVAVSCKKHKYYRKDKGFENDVNFPALFVVNGKSNSLSIVNISSNSVVETYNLKGAEYPHHIYLSPDKSMFAVAFTNTDLSGGHGGHGSNDEKKNMVQVFKTKTGEHVVNIFVEYTPHNAIFSPDGSELWISQSTEEGKIIVVDTKKWKKKSTVTVGNMPSELTFSSDGTKAYSANTNGNSVTIIDVSTKNVLTTVAVEEGPVGAWTASNGKMYVDNETSQSISELDVATNSITETIALGFKPGYVAYNSKTEELWVSDATNGKVVVFQKTSSQWTSVASIETENDTHAICFSADNSIAYVTNQGANSVSIIDVSNRTVSSTISVGEAPNGIIIVE